MFHGKVIAINRKILTSGTREERKAHLAEIVDPFLDELLDSGFMGIGQSRPAGHDPLADNTVPDFVPNDPLMERLITQKEFDRFLKVDLKCIDNPSYFHRHFG